MNPLSDHQIHEARKRCCQYRLRILEISQKLPALHIAPAFSCLELVDAIYFELMRCKINQPIQETFILSKGHGAMAQYAVLEKLGVIPQSEMDLCCQVGGKYGGHPDYGLPGIEASTGSLGHGLPIAIGMALGDKEKSIKRNIYLVVGDGEIMEGSTWEGAMLAPGFGLSSLIMFVDSNGSIARGKLAETHPNHQNFEERFRSFGWETATVDGHDHHSITSAVFNRKGDRPFVAIAKTIKGKGVGFMENQPIWAFRSPNPQEYAIAVNELNQGLQ